MIGVVLMCMIISLWAWTRPKRNPLEPPTLPGGLPLLGHIRLVIGDGAKLWKTMKHISDLSIDYGGVISLSVGQKTVYVLTDPDDCQTVFNHCLEKDALYKFAKPWLGDGLSTASQLKWEHHRKFVNPAFSQQVIDGFLEVFNLQSRRFVKDLEKEVGKGPFDHWEYTKQNALVTICLTAMGIDLNENSATNSEYVKAAKEILDIFAERFQKLWLHNKFLYRFSILKKKQDACMKILNNMTNTVLQKHKEQYFRNKANRRHKRISGNKAFLDRLLELSIEKDVFNDTEIKNHVDTMTASGYEANASVMTYTLLLIGSYPDVQKKLFEEMQQVFGDDDRDVTKLDLSRLVYMEAVLKETMRIYPTVPVIARYLDKDIKLKYYTLTRKRTCILFIYDVLRHPIWGPDAEEFLPERWLDPASIPESLKAFPAFGMGKRNCIGKSFAFVALKTLLAHFLRHYEVFGDHTKMEVKLDVLMKPVSGHHISIKKRIRNFDT